MCPAVEIEPPDMIPLVVDILPVDGGMSPIIDSVLDM